MTTLVIMMSLAFISVSYSGEPTGPFDPVLATMAALDCFAVAIGQTPILERKVAIKHIQRSFASLGVPSVGSHELGRLPLVVAFELREKRD